MVDLALESLDGNFRDCRVGVFGASFKPNSDDIRDSPALDVASRIHDAGAEVIVYDPAALDNARRMYPALDYADSAVGAAHDADVLLHLTEWREFRDMNPAVLDDVVRRKNIVDGRNALDPELWRNAGWHYRALGRP
jgi:UDPglucose 6-dehydrogenase